MRNVQLKDAKASLSRVVDEVLAGEPAAITRHGRREVVMISFEDYERLARAPSLGWLLANSPVEEGDLSQRVHRPARGLTEERF